MRLIDANKIVYSWQIDADGQEHDGVTLQSIINKMPTIKLERKKGKWVGADSQCGIGCPFCGTPVDDFCSSIDYIDLNYKPNFCPNCGADMREGDSE